MSTDKVTITNGTINADTVTVSTQLYTNAVSVTGDAEIGGNLIVNGKDVLQEISGQENALESHALDMGTSTAPHLSNEEHNKLIQLLDMFDGYEDMPVIPVVDSPENAIGFDAFPSFFAGRAMANWPFEAAPGHVYVSRVPYAIATENADGTTSYSCTGSAISAATPDNPLGVTLTPKLLDNADLNHTCSTDTVEGVDDYVGKEWAFFWEYGNYIKDNFGAKHLTSIRGAQPTYTKDGVTYTAPAFDLTKNTAAFGPAFWFFCKPEKWQDPDSGTWLTDDGTETGNPFSQLWGISDSPWSTIDSTHELYNGVTYQGLSDAKKEALTALGVTEADFHLWPSCKIWDEASSKWVIRPYWCHSAFCGGYNSTLLAEIPGQAVVSACNAPLLTSISYQTVNGPSSFSASNTPGSANVNGFGMLFDIVKNATKDSQSIHRGMANGGNNLTVANYAITAAENSTLRDTYGGYVFPVASTSNFNIGRTVRLVNATSGNSEAVYYETGYAMQIGRIKDIRTDLAFTDAGGTAVTGATGLIIDPASDTCNPIQPFAVCTTVADATAIIDTGNYACCGACAGIACAGETMNGGTAGTGVLGYHDGSIVSLTNGKYLYRVQGTEYMPGSYICAADTVAVKGTGAIEVTYWDGSQNVTLTPTSSQYLILTAPPNIKRWGASGESTALASWITAGYEVEGITPATTAGWILNEQLSPNGIAYPVLIGNTSTFGHRDQLYVGANPAEFLSGGYLTNGDAAGSALLSLNTAISSAFWTIASRD